MQAIDAFDSMQKCVESIEKSTTSLRSQLIETAVRWQRHVALSRKNCKNTYKHTKFELIFQHSNNLQWKIIC